MKKDVSKEYVHDPSKLKRQGVNKIKQSLKQKGVSDEDISNAIEHVTDEDQIEIACRKLNSKLESYKKKSKNEYELRGKCYQFLARSGFQSDVIRQSIEQSLNEDLN